LVWLGQAKVARYGRKVRDEAQTTAHAATRSLKAGRAEPAPVPPLRNIERWWSPGQLSVLCGLKGELARRQPSERAADLLAIAFCRAAIGTSNAAFDHPSMSFRSEPRREGDRAEVLKRTTELFDASLSEVLEGAAVPLAGRAEIHHRDARSPGTPGRPPFGSRFQRLVTSPPYPNRMSYIRELRPYMYWTGHLTEARQAGEIDWEAIGGTWGVATSRLGSWRRDPSVELPAALEDAMEQIADATARSGAVLANYVGRYFEDMARHLIAVKPLLEPGAKAHYIVGNAKFYEVLVPTEQILADLMGKAGFRSVSVETIRKRNSKKELYEYDVTAIA
jgi:hypothetical protein